MLKLVWFKKMKKNIYFLIKSFLISLLFFLLLPSLSFAQGLAPIPDVGPIHCVANCGSDTTSTSSCPNNCSGNGRCRKNGSCHCYAGWISDDCLTPESSNYSDPGVCNEEGSNRNLNQGTNCIKGLGGTKGFGERCKVDNGTECMKGLHCVSRQSCVLSKQKKCQCNINSRVAECRPGGYTCGFVGTKCDPQNGQLCCNNLTCVKDYGSSTGTCKQSCR